MYTKRFFSVFILTACVSLLYIEPLEIDLLVIKKEASVRIENEIGILFRGHNIMEYKSPDDALDIDAFIDGRW